MGVFDKVRTKLRTERVRAEEALLDGHSGIPHPEPSINVPLRPDDPYLSTGLMTDDPLKDKRYTQSGLLNAPTTLDADGLIQHMEHLTIAGRDRDHTSLLKGMNPALSIKCGPLLRFITTDYVAPQPLWQGSVMIVSIDDESDYSQRPLLQLSTGGDVVGDVLHTQFGASFWRFDLVLALQEHAQEVTYTINGSETTAFWVPAASQDMNMMFHSCNGFSMNIKQEEFCGPDPMWRDVARAHKQNPFHVMLGGGDQLYCDLVTKRCRLFGEWLNMSTVEHVR